jgi:pimeloyl-ACP methyl ester carboxylesterase
MKRYPITIALLFLVLTNVHAEEKFSLFKLNAREAQLPIIEVSHPNANATVILLPGGDSGTGQIVDGMPTSRNFLVRSRQFFHDQSLNVIVVFRASDKSSMYYDYRLSKEHANELKEIIAHAKSKYKKPVWLVGTSRGTVSAAAAAIELNQEDIAGIVLTASVTAGRAGAIGAQDIKKITIPTLIVHHKDDGCKVCVPSQAASLINRFTSAKVKKFVMIEGGSDPTGDPCGGQHWHGFINFEKETVKIISDWIKSPT